MSADGSAGWVLRKEFVADALVARHGRFEAVDGSGRGIAYAELVDESTRWRVPKEPVALKTPDRFAVIGRPARRDHVALGVLAEKVAAYFESRLPRHGNAVTIQVRAPTSGPVVAGDPVLLEWALEALVRNAVDALSGRGGTIGISVEDLGATAELMVRDDGPGVPPELRASLFEPGVSSKPGGWGIGLALARRIIEDVHHGRLALRASGPGATFVAGLPVDAA